MQRGFGMGKQLLILTAWLSFRGGSASRASAHGSCSPHCCQIILLHYWWGQIFIRQNGAVLPQQHPWQRWYQPSFIFMDSYPNQRLCSSLQFLTRAHKEDSCRSMICPQTTSIYPLHCPNTHSYFSTSPMIFNHAPLIGWLWTLNSPALEERGLEGLPWQRSRLSVLLFIFFHHWLIHPFTLFSPCLDSLWSELYYPSLCTDC